VNRRSLASEVVPQQSMMVVTVSNFRVTIVFNTTGVFITIRLPCNAELPLAATGIASQTVYFFWHGGAYFAAAASGIAFATGLGPVSLDLCVSFGQTEQPVNALNPSSELQPVEADRRRHPGGGTAVKRCTD
jgi:hypothetical protein